MTAHRRRNLALAVAFLLVDCGPIGGEAETTARPTPPMDASPPAVDSSSGGADDSSSIDVTAPNDGPPGSEPVPTDAAHHVAPGGYFVEGATIFTEAGVPHRFHGLNRPSLEWNAAGDHFSQQDFAL